ncbi:thiol:disulfide interchange protein DsbG [Pokkaliibacter sp. CJK22405]|uniref:thiol:disulfide interchange protein DsbG n=1 Tax=Pokkaliibacter sp. CJK22405 TaxID=3384615 RepID=UPI0039848C61
MHPMNMKRLTRHSLLSLGATLVLASGVATAADDLPAPIKNLQAQGVEIKGQFDAPGGVQGYAISNRGQGYTAYVTGDKQHVIVGTMLDAEGNDLSTPALSKLVDGPANVALWGDIEKSHWVREGKEDAPRIVYVFSDPNCGFCQRFWRDAQPWVEAGKVQLRHIMVGVIKPQSAAQSAALLNSKDPGLAIAKHFGTGQQPTDYSDENMQWVIKNTNMMREHNLNYTPVILYKEGDDVQRVDGSPTADKLTEIMGSEKPS